MSQNSGFSSSLGSSEPPPSHDSRRGPQSREGGPGSAPQTGAGLLSLVRSRPQLPSNPPSFCLTPVRPLKRRSQPAHSQSYRESQAGNSGTFPDRQALARAPVLLPVLVTVSREGRCRGRNTPWREFHLLPAWSGPRCVPDPGARALGRLSSAAARPERALGRSGAAGLCSPLPAPGKPRGVRALTCSRERARTALEVPVTHVCARGPGGRPASPEVLPSQVFVLTLSFPPCAKGTL